MNLSTTFVLSLALTIVIAYRQLPRQLPPPTTPRPEVFRRQFSEALEAILGVTVRLQVLLDDPTAAPDNFLVSPPSIAVVLAELMLGANGTFLDQLYELLALPRATRHTTYIFHHSQRRNASYRLPHALLHLQLGNLIKSLKSSANTDAFTLHMANALFHNADLRLDEAFRDNLRIYETEVRALNFRDDAAGAQRAINEWCARNTNGLIDTLLSTPPTPATSALFANAVYFTAEWETPFSRDLNVRGTFASTNQTTVNVTYMSGLFESLPYADSKELQCRLVGLPYKNRELIMYVIVPYEEHPLKYDMRAFATSLKPKLVVSFIESATQQAVAVQLPKLEVSTSFSVLEPLRKYYTYKNRTTEGGVAAGKGRDSLDMIKDKIDNYMAFAMADARPDIVLEAAAANRTLRVSNLLQQVTLRVDEKGTEAAAVTSSIIDYMGGSKSFRVDRPFVFFIRHEATLATLFWGTIVRP